MPANSRGAVDLQDIATALKSAQAYELVHQYADKDYNDQAIHHSLGNRPEQAAPGNHLHAVSATAVNLSSVDITGGNPYVSTQLSNTYRYNLGNSTGPPLSIITMVQLLNAAPGAQRIYSGNLPRPSHDTVNVSYDGLMIVGVGKLSWLWSASENLWFVASDGQSQLSGGWAAGALLTCTMVGQFQ